MSAGACWADGSDVILGREIFDAARLAIDIDGRRIEVVSRDTEPRGVRLDLVTEHGVEQYRCRSSRVRRCVPLSISATARAC